MNANTTANIPVATPHNIDAIHNAFNDVANIYNNLWLLTQNDMPADVISEGYGDFISQLNVLTRIAQDRFTEHTRSTERLAREARVRARHERINVEPPAPIVINDIQPQPVQEPIVQVPPPPPRRQRRARIGPKTKRIVRALKMSVAFVSLPDDCAICMDKYRKINSVETSCGHTFCKGCFNVHEQTAIDRHVATACPLCRSVNPTITEFRYRTYKPRVPAQVNVHVEGATEEAVIQEAVIQEAVIEEAVIEVY